jgi:ABC-type phosphate transport system substrate-binding protein
MLHAILRGWLLWACLCPAAGRAECVEEAIALIASAQSGLREISLPTLRRVYLGTITRLAGAPIDRFHLRSGSPAREAFSLAVIGRSELELEDFWLEQALTGGRVPPREFADLRQMIEGVARRPGGIGYLPLGALDEAARGRVRVLRLLDGPISWTPADPGYPVRVCTPASR